jgi:hypothetical protein
VDTVFTLRTHFFALAIEDRCSPVYQTLNFLAVIALGMGLAQISSRTLSESTVQAIFERFGSPRASDSANFFV